MVQKKRVSGQPMCSERQVKLIDPMWIPGPVPPRFWLDRKHRRDYLLCLGWKLRFRKVEDWYRLRCYHLTKNNGYGVLKWYDSSPALAMIDCFPEYEWHEWCFGHVPRGFWAVSANRRRYMRWLGEQMGFRRPQDWYAIRQEDFEAHQGTRPLSCYSSMYDLLQEFLPQLDWEPYRCGPLLSIEQILELADTYFAEHGTRPNSHSGPIAGTNITWSSINERLRRGYAGSCAGSSLHALLVEHRGVQSVHQPPLTENQVLAWADAFYGEHSQWPTALSGSIAGTRETWSGIDHALRNGFRGLRSGSSLARLLNQCRGVRNSRHLPPLSERKIVAWARTFHRATGRWPTRRSGPIPDSSGETWESIARALFRGRRGLKGGSNVQKLLKPAV